MNKWAWMGIGFAGGAVAGGIVGWFLKGKKTNKEPEEELIDTADILGKPEIVVSNTLPKSEAIEKDIQNLEEARTQLAEMAKRMNDIKKSYWHYPDEEEKILKKTGPKEEDKTPYVISEEEYLKGDYDQMDLGYYDEDDTLISWSTNSVVDEDDRMRMLGDESVWMNFGEMSEDPDTIHVRNPEQEVDFEIVCIHGKCGLGDPLEEAFNVMDMDIPDDDIEEE